MFKKFQKTPTIWTQDDIRYNWVSNTGRRIHLQDDLCICVSSIEDYYLRRYARVALLDYGIYVQGEVIQPKPGAWDYLGRCFPTRETSIFGMSLERALKIERRLHSYPQQRINSQYRFHLPYYFIGSIRSISTYGLRDDNVLQDEGNPLWVNLMLDQLRRGDVLTYKSRESVHELSTILKIFLLELPGGLLTEELEGLFLLAGGKRMQSRRLEVIQLLVQALPRANREALFLLMSLSKQVVMATIQNTSDLAAAFRRVLFVNDNRPTADMDIVIVFDAMITRFEDIFNLPAETLDYIYQQLVKFEPDKLSENLERRINNRFWESSDIPENLIILNKRHSYETCPFEAFYKVEDTSPVTTLTMVNDFLKRSTNTYRSRRQLEENDLDRLKEELQKRITYFPKRSLKSKLRCPRVDRIEEDVENGSTMELKVPFKLERRYSF